MEAERARGKKQLQAEYERMKERLEVRRDIWKFASADLGQRKEEGERGDIGSRASLTEGGIAGGIRYYAFSAEKGDDGAGS